MNVIATTILVSFMLLETVFLVRSFRKDAKMSQYGKDATVEQMEAHLHKMWMVTALTIFMVLRFTVFVVLLGLAIYK